MKKSSQFEGDITAASASAIRTLLGNGQATIGGVAKALGLTPRTLQRRLRTSGATFSHLLATTRAGLAREGLANGQTSTQLASVLGFSESSAVSRFLRETGVTQDVKRALRAQGSSIERVTDAIYDSDRTDRWIRAAQAIGAFLEGVHIRFWVRESSTDEVVFDQLTPGLPTFLPKAYDQHYFRTDPAIPALLARPWHPISCAEIEDPVESDRSALVTDLLDKPDVDVRWRMMEAARLDSGALFFFAAGRSRRRGPFVSAETHRHDMVFRRLKHALEFELRISALNERRRVFEYALDALPSGVFVVTKDLDVLHANETAIGMVGTGKGLEFAFGKLRGARMKEQAAIEQIVAAAAYQVEGPLSTIIRSDDGRTIQARAYRVPRTSFVNGGDGACQVALVISTDN
jgi:AraC-like DNA-binding protein